MPLDEELILDRLKFKIVKFLLRINIKIGQRLARYHAKFSADNEIDQVAQRQNFDMRGVANRMKAVMIHDQDIIDKRWAECEKCEHLKTNEKMNTKYHQCNLCKCMMKVGDTYIKTRVATAKCPLDPPKWDKEYNFIKGQPTNGTKPITK